MAAACAVAFTGIPPAARAASAGPGAETSIVVEPTSPEYEAERARAAAQAKASAAKKSGGAASRQASLEQTFAAFCDGWAAKLRQRQKDNVAKIRWSTGTDGRVVGEYVGYDTDHLGPATVTHAESTPIGRLVYQEVLLRRSGASREEALASEPVVVERTEVTELFRHDGRGWVY